MRHDVWDCSFSAAVHHLTDHCLHQPNVEFWDANKTSLELNHYFRSLSDHDQKGSSAAGAVSW